MSEEKVQPNEHGKDDAVPQTYPVDPATERETADREQMRRKEEQKHHEQTGS